MEAYEQLEHDLARWSGRDNVVACASGTAALHLALEGLQLPAGSKVLVPDFTMIACARAVSLAGLVPVFVDCDADGCMNADLVLKYMRDTRTGCGRGVRAIMPVHIYGRLCGPALFEAAQMYELAVVEDCAEAHGADKFVGVDAVAGHARCWSFYKNKIVAGEEGGAVAFTDYRCAMHARRLRSLGFTERHDFNHIPRGHNYRISNTHARLVCESLRGYNDSLTYRRMVELMYNAACPETWRQPPRQAPWVYDIRVPGLWEERQMDAVTLLHDRGIPARRAFQPMSTQLEYRNCEVVGDARMAGILAREVLYLPITPATTQEQVDTAFITLKDLLPLPHRCL
jgi:perosamine synthetase